MLLGHGKTCYLSQGYWSQGYLLVQHPIVKVDHRGGIRKAKLLSRFKMAASMVSFCSMVEDNFRGVGGDKNYMVSGTCFPFSELS